MKLFNQENIEKIKRLIDIEDTAKYLALFSLYNNAHSLAGDNLKYIYNLSTGKFRFIFRSESHPRLMQVPLSSFNLGLFESYNPGHNPPLTFKLFKVLLKDDDFRNKETNIY